MLTLDLLTTLISIRVYRLLCTTTCRRRVILAYFGDTRALTGAPIPFNSRCCDLCEAKVNQENFSFELAILYLVVSVVSGVNSLPCIIDLLAMKKFSSRWEKLSKYAAIIGILGIGSHRSSKWWFSFVMGPACDANFIEFAWTTSGAQDSKEVTLALTTTGTQYHARNPITRQSTASDARDVFLSKTNIGMQDRKVVRSPSVNLSPTQQLICRAIQVCSFLLFLTISNV